MKKTLAILLTLAMLLSLCACGSDDTQSTDPTSSIQAGSNTQPESTESTTNGNEDATEGTPAPSDEPTSEPTEEPTTAPTETEPPACTHNWKNATCQAPKTCTVCGATEGGLAGHSYSGGTCSVCGTADPNYKNLTDGTWIFQNSYAYVALKFNTNGYVSICVLDVAATVDEFRNMWHEYILDEYGWYSVYHIDGADYVARHEIEYDSRYTVDGQTVSYDIFQFPESLTWDGYTVTAAAESGSGWMSNMGTATWSASGVYIIEDLGPYFTDMT